MKAFLGSLTSLVELDLGTFPYGSYESFAADSLLKSLTKKLVTERAADAREAAIAKFLHFNKKCEDYVPEVQNSWDEELIGTIRMVLNNFFYPKGEPLIEGYLLKDALKPGPGAAVGAVGESLYAKLFSSPLTFTSHWVKADFLRFTRSNPLLRCAFSGTRQLGMERVDCSRLSAVPKENEIDRIICIEPSLNMMYQQGLRALLEDRLKSYFGIDLAVQPGINSELARQGSLSGTFGTIDLRSASDCVSLKLVDWLFPREVVNWLKLLRTPRVDIRGRKVDLHMISTMGNAFTFPLQTILFAAIVRAVYLQLDLPIRNPRGPGSSDSTSFGTYSREVQRVGNWGVFGDDIVVDTRSYRRVIQGLELCGFEPNTKKSFYQGPFRESCGSDWFNGRPVRGIYWKDLTTDEGRFVALNQINEWTARTGIPLPSVCKYLMETVPLNYVPLHESDDSGIRVPSSFLGPCAPGIYHALVKEPKKIRMNRKAVNARGWVYNSFGCYISFLYGEIRDGSITPRGEYRIRYRQRSTFNWDGLPMCTGDVFLRSTPLERVRRVAEARAEARAFEYAVWANLN